MEKCFNCGIDLGPDLERMKMETEKGKICYECFNMLSSKDADSSTGDE